MGLWNQCIQYFNYQFSFFFIQNISFLRKFYTLAYPDKRFLTRSFNKVINLLIYRPLLCHLEIDGLQYHKILLNTRILATSQIPSQV